MSGGAAHADPDGDASQGHRPASRQGSPAPEARSLVCPNCGHKQPQGWEGFNPIAEMICDECRQPSTGWKPVEIDDSLESQLRRLQDFGIDEMPPALSCWAECCWRDFEVDWQHVHREIALALPPGELRGVRTKELLEVLARKPVPQEELAMWLDFSGQQLMKGQADIRERLQTVVDYVDSGTCKSDAADRLRCIVVMLREDKEEKFFVPRILCLLAQNGNLCHVQKEVGIRNAYASMTSTGKEEADAGSAENLLLQNFAALREVLVEAQAQKVCDRGECGLSRGNYNTHYIIPIRNSYSKRSGLPYMPDLAGIGGGTVGDGTEFSFVRGITEEASNRWFDEFAATYAPWVIHWCADEHVNNRSVPFAATEAWFAENPPETVDAYDFRAWAIPGHVTRRAIFCMLFRMGVLRGVAGAFSLTTREEERRGALLDAWKYLWKLWDRTVEEESQRRFMLRQEYDASHAELIASPEAEVCFAEVRRQSARKRVEGEKRKRDLRPARMSTEAKKLQRGGAIDGVELRAADGELLQWGGTIIGPPGTPYDGAIFRFEATIPVGYPQVPPDIKLLTRIHHPRVDSLGRIDHPLLKGEGWAAKKQLVDGVVAVRDMLAWTPRQLFGEEHSQEQVAEWRRAAQALTDEAEQRLS